MSDMVDLAAFLCMGLINNKSNIFITYAIKMSNGARRDRQTFALSRHLVGAILFGMYVRRILLTRLNANHYYEPRISSVASQRINLT